MKKTQQFLAKLSAFFRNKYYGWYTKREIIKKTPNKIINSIEFLKDFEEKDNKDKKCIIQFKDGSIIEGIQNDLSAIAETSIIEDYQKNDALKIQAGDVVFDVGAHIGSFSVYAAKKGAIVYAFEPNTKNFQNLKHNIEINKLQTIHPFPFAIGNHNGKVSLKESSINSGGHSIISSTDTIGDTPIEMKTIESFCKEKNIQKINLLKIDVEGSEYEIFNNPATAHFVIVDKIVGEYHLNWQEPEKNFRKIKKLLSKDFKKIARYAPYYFYAIK